MLKRLFAKIKSLIWRGKKEQPTSDYRTWLGTVFDEPGLYGEVFSSDPFTSWLPRTRQDIQTPLTWRGLDKEIRVGWARPNEYDSVDKPITEWSLKYYSLGVDWAKDALIDEEMRKEIEARLRSHFTRYSDYMYTPYIKPQSDPSQDHLEEGDPNASTSECSPVDPGC